MSTSNGNGSLADAIEPVDSDEELVEPTDLTDGRSLRRRRNRDAVITSLIDLVNEGDVNPTIDKIAERADVSARSIFRYFTDLNDLARTAVETEMVAALPVAVIPDRGEGDLEHRIEQLIGARRRLYTRVHRLFLVAVRKEHDIDEVERGLRTMASLMRDQMRLQFAPELSQLDDEAADQLASMLTAAMAIEAYDHLSRRLERTDDEIYASWSDLLRRVFA